MRTIISKLAIIALAFGGITSADAQDKIDFEKQIWPFVKESCSKCHLPRHKDKRGRTRKPKAGLVITNKAAFLEGADGEEDDTKVPVIVAGKPDESSFYTLTLEPEGSDDIMPPADKAEPWTKEQKELFKKWIEEGADFGKWERDPEIDKKMEEKK